jgi:thiol-disulfide isomerase/thioredoxin
MRKISIFISLLVLVLALSACEEQAPETSFDYSDFPTHLVTSYEELEQREERYVAYYYGEYCSHCATVKQDLLSFFSTFETLPFYILNTSDTPDVSSREEFYGTPTIFVYSKGDIIDSYIGVDAIYDFMVTYRDIDEIPLDYTHFSSQHVETYQELLDIEQDKYLVYYYLENCPHCIAAKPDFLKWAFQHDVKDIYFVNAATVADQTVPTELLIFNSGTPVLAVMSNGEFADEYYSGTDEVLNYIATIGDAEINPDEPVITYEYSDFQDHQVSTYDDLELHEGTYVVYYYSPFCGHCESIKQDILEFLSTFDTYDYYMLDTSDASGVSNFDEFYGTPTVFVVEDGVIQESYIGTFQITDFIVSYSQ